MFIIDLETTGLDPSRHSPVSAAVLDFSNPTKTPLYVVFRAWDGAEINPASLELNGFTEEQVRRTNPFSFQTGIELILDYIEKCRVKIPAGINVGRLDIPMMVEGCRRIGREWYYEKNSIDLHALVAADYLRRGIPIPLDQHGKSALGSTQIFKYVGLPPEPKPHHALTGARMEAEAFSRLIYGRNLLLEYAGVDISHFLLENSR